MIKKKLYAKHGSNTVRHTMCMNPESQKLMDSCAAILEQLTGINCSSTVIFRRALAALATEQAKLAIELKNTDDPISALAEARLTETAMLISLAGRDAHTPKKR